VPTAIDKEIYNNISEREFVGDTFEMIEARREAATKNIPKQEMLPRGGRPDA
jgi:hypothetical protein